MTTTEHTLTEFLQHSGRVLAQVERGGLLLHRRDGEDLVVMTRGQSEALGGALRVLAGAVLTAIERDTAIADSARVVALLPWMAYLSPGDRVACMKDIGEAASAAVGTGRIDRLEDVLADWRATGLASWDAQRLRERADYAEYLVEDPQPLERPSE